MNHRPGFLLGFFALLLCSVGPAACAGAVELPIVAPGGVAGPASTLVSDDDGLPRLASPGNSDLEDQTTSATPEPFREPATATPFQPQSAAAGTTEATDSAQALATATATNPVSEALFLESTCPTPRSLMLHSAFGPQRMQELAQEIERRGWRTATYRSLLDTLRAGECPADDLVIVSVDDVGTSWLRPTFKEMIQVFVERDMVLVLAVVVRPPQDPAIWQYLQSLVPLGIEVASHTINHYSLPRLREEVREEEISGSYDIICEELGRCPVTLVLPFGNGGVDESVLNAAYQYPFVVGIREGRTFAAAPPYHLGRIPPNNDNQAFTLDMLDSWVDR